MKLILVSPFPLHPVRTGAARRSIALAAHLIRQGHTVSLICPRPTETTVEPTPADFQWRFFRRGPRFLHLFHPSIFNGLRGEIRKGCDGIILSFPFQILPIWVISRMTGIPFYLDAHNVEHARFFSMQRYGTGTAVFFLEWLAVRGAQEIFAVSQEDRLLFQKRFGRNGQWIPNGVDTGIFLPDGAAPGHNEILFFGNFAYHPNLNAAKFICETLSPALPQMRFRIAGPDTPALPPCPNVTLLGPVPDIRESIARADLVIAPLAAEDGGGGSRLKILEAMACGKSVLCTPAAARGLPPEVQGGLRLAPLEDFEQEIRDFFAGGWGKDMGLHARKAAESMDWRRCFAGLAITPRPQMP